MPATTTTSKPKSTKTTTASKATATSKVTSSATHSSTQHVSSPSSASISTISSSGTLGPSPSAQPESTNADKSGLSTPAIAGIAAGGVIVLFILSIFICKKRRAYQYAKRDFGYDPSRDPIHPNDMFPPDNKYDQSNSSPHSRPPPPPNGSGFVTYPLAVLGADQQRDTKPRLADSDQDPRSQYEYQHHADHIQSHSSPQSPDLQTHPVVGAPNSRAPTLPPLSTTQSSSNTGSSPPMSPSQRAKLNNQRQNNSQGSNSPRSPRSHLQQHPLDSRSEPDSFLVNDMGNHFVMQNGSTGPSRQVMDHGRGGVDQEGPLKQGDISYRQPTMMNQESSVIGMGSQHPSPQPGPYHRPPGSPSFQQQNIGAGPNNVGGSPYSSPRSGPTHHSSGSPLMQYQYPPQAGPMYSPQQRPPYPGRGPVRSPPLGAQRGPGYAQANPNYRPYTNY